MAEQMVGLSNVVSEQRATYGLTPPEVLVDNNVIIGGGRVHLVVMHCVAGKLG
jgi:hypothetical protein